MLISVFVLLNYSSCSHNTVGHGEIGAVAHDELSLRKRLVKGGTIRLKSDGLYTFDAPLQVTGDAIFIKGEGAIIQFVGAPGSNLLRVLGNDVTIENVIFDGGNRQVLGALAVISEGAENIIFKGCTFTNIRGGMTGNSRFVNNQYAVLIDPNGVSCSFINCTFSNILSENKGTSAYAGKGFVGGVFFYPENLLPPPISNGQPTNAVFDNCRFENIRTLLSEGLTAKEQTVLSDSDAIRTYSENNDKLELTIKKTTFIDIGKRAIKFSGTRGGLVEDCRIIDNSLPYPMTSAIKLSQENTIRRLSVEAPSIRPISYVFQSHQARAIVIEDVDITNATVLYNSAPAKGTLLISNVILQRINCFNCQGGLINSGFAEIVEAASQRNILIDNQCGMGFRGHENLLASSGNNTNVIFDVEVRNGWVKLGGRYNDVENIVIQIDTLTANSFLHPERKIFEAFGGIGAAKITHENVLKGLKIRVDRITPNYFTNKRKTLALLYGTSSTYEDVTFQLPNDFEGDAIELLGNDLEFKGLDIKGGGRIRIGRSEIVTNGVKLKNIRYGQGVNRAQKAMLLIDNVKTLHIDGIDDLSDLEVPSIFLINTTGKLNSLSSSKAESKVVAQRSSNVLLTKFRRRSSN